MLNKSPLADDDDDDDDDDDGDDDEPSVRRSVTEMEMEPAKPSASPRQTNRNLAPDGALAMHQK